MTKNNEKISVVLAVRNEEENIRECIESVKGFASEVVVFDESSDDDTRKIARSMGAKVYKVKHETNFHITKQKALEKAKYDWILQLDADERITQKLADEIVQVTAMKDQEIKNRKYPKNKEKLFLRHERILRQLHRWNDKGEVVAFWIPRKNIFLGKPLIHAGVYPDPAIRLVKKDKAWFPMKSVHEFMQFDGATAWLFNDMIHMDSPTLSRYLKRLNRYTDLQAKEHEAANLSKSFFTFTYFSSIKPFFVFCKLYFLRAGFKDGIRGFVWSAFSSLHFPISYYKYYEKSFD